MSKLPAYQIVCGELKKEIMEGKYQIGDLLPAEPELEERFHVSRTTVRKAISLLVLAGLISVRQGYGTEVIGMTPNTHYHKFHNVVSVREQLHEELGEFNFRGIYIDTVRAEGQMAAALEVAEGTPVYRMQRLPFLGDTPFGFICNYLRQDFFPDLDKHSQAFANLYDFLERQYGVTFEYGDEVVTATVADLVDARLLGIKVGDPLLLFRRTAQSKNGPLEYVETKLRPDTYELHIQMQGAPSRDYFRQ